MSKEAYFKQIGIPANLISAEFSPQDDPTGRLNKIIEGVNKYLETASKDSKSIIFHGQYGSGKTFVATQILKHMAYKKYFTSWFLTLDDVYELVSESWKNDEAKKNRDNKLFLSQCLLIDNIPQALNKSRDIKEVLPIILRKRLASGGITYLTTAVDPKEWKFVFGNELLSLFGENFQKVSMPNIDFRK